MYPFMTQEKGYKMIKRRGRIVGAVLILCLVVLVARLAQLQILQHGEWAALAASIQERTVKLDPRRGTIYDRNGTPLAFDVKAAAIAIDSYNMTRPVTLSQILSEELGMSRDEVERLIYRPSYFTWIDRKVDLETAERIRDRADAADANGLIFVDTWKRCYPQRDLASNLIGFVGVDGHGLEGIELRYDDELSGTPTVLRVVRGADGRTYHTETIEEGTPGEDIYLTIDARLQFVCEDEIDSGVSRYRANTGFIVLLDPKTGEVLAMAQDCRYDLNDFSRSTPAERKNLPVSFLFEPGSTFKAFTGLAALKAGVVAVDDEFDGSDGIVIAGHTIHNSENESFGTVTFREIIQNSINTGMIRVAQLLGEERLHDFLVELGFGEKTGIELPGEEAGILRDVEDWSALALASTAIGQSVGVTGIQLARAMAAIANGGNLLRPRIVLRIGDGREGEPKVIREIASEEGCATMRGLLRLVVERGTAMPADMPGFDVAGKTGTAQKAVPGRGYVPGKYTSLFCGFLPKDDPEYLALVVLDEVKTTPVWGGATAGTIFHDALSRIALISHLAPVAER